MGIAFYAITASAHAIGSILSQKKLYDKQIDIDNVKSSQKTKYEDILRNKVGERQKDALCLFFTHFAYKPKGTPVPTDDRMKVLGASSDEEILSALKQNDGRNDLDISLMRLTKARQIRTNNPVTAFINNDTKNMVEMLEQKIPDHNSNIFTLSDDLIKTIVRSMFFDAASAMSRRASKLKTPKPEDYELEVPKVPRFDKIIEQGETLLEREEEDQIKFSIHCI